MPSQLRKYIETDNGMVMPPWDRSSDADPGKLNARRDKPSNVASKYP